jgi:NAD(P)-dependent dehydrogenase (short-subunit alcohol dehydrogenase family)
MYDIKNMVIVVVGALGRLGQAWCNTIRNEGGICIAADICIPDSEENEWLRNLDVSKPISVQRLVDDVHEMYGRIDAVINASYPRGKNYGRKLEDVQYVDFCETINLHIGGAFLLCQKMFLYFSQQGYGNIINVASIYGLVAPKFEIYDGTSMTMPVEYAASKAAICQMTRYFAAYSKGKKIRVNCIAPGGISAGQESAFVEKYSHYCLNKGLLNESDTDGVLLFLLSNNSLYVNGQIITIDDGWTL